MTLGMEILNSMMEMWQTLNIDIGTTPLENPGDNLNEPPDARNAIINNLALELAPSFDNGQNVVSRVLENRASAGFQHVRNLYQVHTIPPVVVSSTLPVGAGNEAAFRRGRIFFGKGAQLGSKN